MTDKGTLCNMNIIGERVVQRRTDLNLKQQDLIDKLESYGISITRSGISKLERKQRRCTDFELVAIAKALSVSLNWLCGLE